MSPVKEKKECKANSHPKHPAAFLIVKSISNEIIINVRRKEVGEEMNSKRRERERKNKAQKGKHESALSITLLILVYSTFNLGKHPKNVIKVSCFIDTFDPHV